MRVTTEIPCGNGRVVGVDGNHVEIEVIAYSKNPRYFCVEVDPPKQAREIRVTLRPDSQSVRDFSRFHSTLWTRTREGATWQAIPEADVERAPEAVRFTVQIEQQAPIQISSEPPRPFSHTCADLVRLTQDHPESTRLYVLGASVEDRPIVLLRVADQDAGPAPFEHRPSMLVISGEHASEFAGEEVARGMLAALLKENDFARQVRRDCVCDFILVANPDGNYHGWHQYNATDWKEHNYEDGVDRSWHHEFVRYFNGPRDDLSPETRAIGKYIQTHQPQFVVDIHSWEGHEGRMGCFRPTPARCGSALQDALLNLDAMCLEVLRSHGLDFEIHASDASKGHLKEYLLFEKGVPAYTLEAHMNIGRERLQAIGGDLIERWMRPGGVDLSRATESVKAYHS